jgi:hypothetical protein
MEPNEKSQPDMFEKEDNVLAESLDADFFDYFRKHYTEDYQHLVCDPEILPEQKRAYLKGVIADPLLEYPGLWKVDYLEKELALLDLREKIEHENHEEHVCGAYLWKIDEQIDMLKMLQAARDQDDEGFAEYSRKIYGEPSPEVYAYTLKCVRREIDEALASFDMGKQEAAKRLRDTILHDEILRVDTSDLELLADDLRKRYVLQEDGVVALSAAEIRAGFEGKLSEYGIEGWRVEVDMSGKYRNLGVNQEIKVAYIPSDDVLAHRKDPITAERLEMLAAHELGTHALRRECGEQSPLQLLGFGLDRHLHAEEGIAKYSEQKIRGFDDFSNNIGYLKAGLVMGLDGVKRNFGDLYSIMVDYEYITTRESGDGVGLSARDRAWEGCVRTFRGTTGKTPGACFTKDIVYREGNIAVWKLLRDNPEMEQYFMLGKYDPTNRRHVALLQQLGILPKAKDERVMG